VVALQPIVGKEETSLLLERNRDKDTIINHAMAFFMKILIMCLCFGQATVIKLNHNL
jgi:hypothetical protein